MMPVVPSQPMDPIVAGKLDGGLRRLLVMGDDDIRRAVRRDRDRLQRVRRRLAAAPAPAEVRAATGRLQPHPVWGVVKLTRSGRRPIQARAIVRFNGNRDDLVGLGLTVHSQAHDVFTVEGTPAELRALADQPATRALRLPRLMLPDVEEACAQAGVNDVHQPRPPANPTGYRGRGTIVGVVDSPLDVEHATFREATGNHATRVLYYWVQNDPTATPAKTPQGHNGLAFNGLNYGRLYTQSDLDAALANPAGTYGNGPNQIATQPRRTPVDAFDPGEHGTHCAGIAVGNGHDANYTVGPHVGAAPEATLIHVCNDYGWSLYETGGFEDRLIDATDFIFRAADLHGMPAVASVSQGTSLGPHDGHSLFDIDRDNKLDSFDGRSIVWSAGNDNNDDGFTRGAVAAGTQTSHTLTPTRSVSTNVFLDIWYSGPELDVALSRPVPSGNPLTTGWVTAGQSFSNLVGNHQVEIDRDPEPSANKRGIRLYIQSTHKAHTWTVDLRNPHASRAAAYWAWAGHQGRWASLSGAMRNEMTLSDAACARSILTVGACAKVLPPNTAAGEQITSYSGAGPTLDGRVKPEVVAVGGTSANGVESAGTVVLHSYGQQYGTSMATPLVAGLVALLMEERSLAGATIDQDTIKALLIEYANRLNLNLDPSLPGYSAADRNRYGYGRVRAVGPIDHHLLPEDVDVWVKTAPDDFGHQPFLGDIFWVAPEIRICPKGSPTETNELEWGHEYDVTVTVRNLGADDAPGTKVWLKYTRPFTAPTAWTNAEDTTDAPLHTTVDVPALGAAEVHFLWRPDQGEVPPPYPDRHFCVLCEVSHDDDKLAHPAQTGSGGSAWESNIKGTNNVALRNVSIR